MKKALLYLFIGAAALSDASEAYCRQEVRVVQTIDIARGAKIQICEDASGYRFKRFITPTATNNEINPFSMAKRRTTDASVAAESEFFESFEGWDSSDEWLPQGWDRQQSTTAGIAYTWHVSGRSTVWYPTPADGDNYAWILYSAEQQDEWLITPAIDIADNFVLTYDLYFQPATLFLIDEDHFDFDNNEYIEKSIAATLEIQVREEGGTWQKVKDIADDYYKYTYMELAYMTPTSMIQQTVSLAEFAGKKVQIAFRYVGKDGDAMFIDAVKVGLPQIEPSFSWPYSTQYWGTMKDDGSWSFYPYPVAQLPVNCPVTWENTTNNDVAQYRWSYIDPVTSSEASSNEESLTITFKPNYTNSEKGTPLYAAPTLYASAPGASEGSFSSAIELYQAGGQPEATLQDNSVATIGLLPFDILSEGFGIYTEEPYDYGEPAIPIFGYSDRTAQWWTDYTFGNDVTTGDNAEVISYLNFIYPTEAPLVVTGLWTQAKGQISSGAEFKAEIVPLDEEYQPTSPIATATCKGEDVIVVEGGMQNFLTIPFTFESPVVLSSTQNIAYVVKISGFNDPANVTYFAPGQSLLPNPDQLCFGWIEKSITWLGDTRTSTSPLANIAGEYGDCYNSFMINLEAFYPWLDCEEETVELGADGKKAVTFDSFYDAKDLTCTQVGGSALPDWLTFKAEGRYNSTIVTFEAGVSASNRECDVVVSAPGVSKAIKVYQKGSTGIEDITISDNCRASDIYTVSGLRVDKTDRLPAGLYIVRHADGTASKIVVK